jgi:hypothetical protein
MRASFLLVLFTTPLAACGGGDNATTGAAEDAASDVSVGDDVALNDTTSADSADFDAGPDVGDGTSSEVASDAPSDVSSDTATPTCTPAGTTCGKFGACCPGNTCVDGFCRGCVAKGGFCTWSAADRCCSGSCDGDSCNGYPVGHACTSNAQCQLNNCVGGFCACAIGDAACGTAGACVDIEYNDAHCGACGKACGPNQRCLAGKCECKDTFTTNCGDDCYDTRVDEAHCGACGKACRTDQVCAWSACQCATGTECSGACVSLGSDPNNCGSCGKVCPTDHPRCSSGVCVCATGLTQCSAGCVDLKTDRNNCGTCGNVCNGMKSCVAGVCG